MYYILAILWNIGVMDDTGPVKTRARIRTRLLYQPDVHIKGLISHPSTETSRTGRDSALVLLPQIWLQIDIEEPSDTLRLHSYQKSGGN